MSGNVFLMWCIKICETVIRQCPHTLFELRAHKVQTFGKVGCPAVCCLASVCFMPFEKLLFGLQSSSNGLVVVDVSLTAVHNWDIAKP